MEEPASDLAELLPVPVPVIWQNSLYVEDRVPVIWQNYLSVEECASDLAELPVCGGASVPVIWQNCLCQ